MLQRTHLATGSSLLRFVSLVYGFLEERGIILRFLPPGERAIGLRRNLHPHLLD